MWLPRARTGFTLIELLVVITIIGLLMAILLPAMEHVRHQGYIDKCASNLRQIGIAMTIYSNENQNNFPRTLYVPGAPLTEGTGFSTTDPFQPGGVSPNDLTAAVYLLVRTEHLPTELVICPYNDVTDYSPDPANPQSHSNFTDWTKNLSYSFADPYPDASVLNLGYRLTNRLRGDFPLASDLNPGKQPPIADVTAAAIGASARIIENANSLNHEQDGQNVLYADGHVTFQQTPLCGIGQDNIFTNQIGQVTASPVTPLDAVLLPAN